MKTKWHLLILWSVLSLGLLSCEADRYDSPFTRRGKVFKLATPKSKLTRSEDKKSRQRLTTSRTSLTKANLTRSSSPFSTPATPRSMGKEKPEAKMRSIIAYLPDVSVTCSASDFVVRVKPAFYGLGADAKELKLGSSCKSNGVLTPYGDLLFTYPLTKCDGVRELSQGELVYKYVLRYEPSQKRFPSRAHRISVDIECRYQRDHHVHQLAVQPTWQTVVVRKSLKGHLNYFQIDVLSEPLGEQDKSPVYHLGQPVYFQVSAPYLPAGERLYISSCHATPSSDSKSSLRYTFIDNSGCLLDSKADPGASQFISRTDKTLLLSLKAFQFIADPDTEVSVHCNLFVTSEGPGPAHKSCTYKGNRWMALTGHDSICECCESQCVTSKWLRAVNEGHASSEPLLVSDQPYVQEDDLLPVGGEEKTNMNHDSDDLHSRGQLWGSIVIYEDGEEEAEEQLEESGIIYRPADPDEDEPGFRDEWNEFEEDGSVYEENDFSDSEMEHSFEGIEDDIPEEHVMHLNEKGGEVLSPWFRLEQTLPSDVGLKGKAPDSIEEEEGHGAHAGSGEVDEGMINSEVQRKNDGSLADVVDNGEMTWFFTWK
ncbi:zona pellucida sperm-binding protein 3 [Mugil cephalus]|uniref:zona pellucida sperm-binding protein 3 n=1 Tax=Mugil cephalus TaxID=48193 RepID=UPI001FB6EACB|nr:zona pellucida sperm-binding protein 3 [Mugil cephalus]